jgi:hypothetical protein
MMATEHNFWEDSKLRDLLIKLLRDSEKARDFLDGDGHSIYDGTFLIAAGYPESFIKKYESTLTSDYSSGKTTIFDNQGNMVDSMTGIAALTFHYAVASALWLEGGVDYDDTIMGRGTQARELSKAIMKAIGMPGAQPAVKVI